VGGGEEPESLCFLQGLNSPHRGFCLQVCAGGGGCFFPKMVPETPSNEGSLVPEVAASSSFPFILKAQGQEPEAQKEP
jgi:hypothetical protein